MNLDNIIISVLILTHTPVLNGIYHTQSTIMRLYASIITVISCLMHATERKHGINGKFSKYSKVFLLLDRISSICGILYFLPKIFTSITVEFMILFTVGFIALVLGEHLYKSQKIAYMFAHSVWHLCVFYLLGEVIQMISL